MYLWENLIVYVNYYVIFVIIVLYLYLLLVILIFYLLMIVYLSLVNWIENEVSLVNLVNELLLWVLCVEYLECMYVYKYVFVWCVLFFINMKLLWYFCGVIYGFYCWKVGL